jgi:YD repeat-containing protein
VENGTTNTFGYDALNRIVSSDQFAETYTYDNRGNRTGYTRNKLFENNNETLEFDQHNRLTAVATNDGKEVSYRYNGDNLLYERTENGETTRYYYDGQNVIAEATVTGGVATLKARYIRGRGLVAVEDADRNKSYYLHNGHGDVTELRDETGNTRLNHYTYDIWGNPVIEQETAYNSFRYSGELWDKTTSLKYLRARWYDSSDGRFIH